MWWLPLTRESLKPNPSTSKMKSEKLTFFEPESIFESTLDRFAIAFDYKRLFGQNILQIFYNSATPA